MKGLVRLRSVDDIVLVLFASRARLAPELQRWYEALERPGVRATMCLATGPLRSESSQRRRTVAVLRRLDLPVVAITDHRFNRGLVRVFGYLGVSIRAYEWRSVDEASRSVASSEARVQDIVEAALELRTEAEGQAGVSGVLRS